MRLSNATLSLSPSDLTAYLACEHLTQLELAVLRGELARPLREDPHADLIRLKGDEHERVYLERLRAEGRDVVAITIDQDNGDWDLERAARETEEAMRAGRGVIYQGAFLDGGWRGFADFLVRVDEPSDLGPWSYEAVDTKLARHPKPYFILQLCFYSEQVARLQGRGPDWMHVVLGTGETDSFRPQDFGAYYRRVRARFLDAVQHPHTTEPWPVDHCRLCDFRELCEAWWDERDHLVRVAGIRRDQIVRLGTAGIETLKELGEAAPETPIPRMADATFQKLRGQAGLQLAYRRSGVHRWQTLEPEAERGFALLPKPSAGDLFFDIEGDPFWEAGLGLEYLFGLTEIRGSSPRFRPLWAHDHDEERRAFEELVDFFHDRLSEHPDLHVYHYAPYEPNVLKRLAALYATREEEVDELLRREVLVDLYAVVRQGLRISHPRYSLKNVEQFYLEREAELRAGDDSILLYERWRDERDPAILLAIQDYNEEDCLSTYRLREWLLERKAEAESEWATEIVWREPPDLREPDEEEAEAREERERLRTRLLEAGDEALALAAHLLDYHRREAKPVWWAFFGRLERTSEELIDDAEAIGGLELSGEPDGPPGTARTYPFRFPVQQHKLDEGDTVLDPVTGKTAGKISELDDVAGTLRLWRSARTDEEWPLPRALVPGGPYETRCQREALMRLGRSLQAGDGRYDGLEGLLRREPPLGGARVQVHSLEAAKLLVERIEGRHLFIQGPPGSGKTYTGARLIVHLIGRGQRVGVAATSHKAIHNLLREVETVASLQGVEFQGLKKSTGGNAESAYEGPFIRSSTSNEDFVDEELDLVAGTAWLLARRELDQTIDYLFVDEAGQVSLADALAMGTSARTLVLLGDPLQLAQVRQGIHPTGSGASVLEHLLGDAQTIPEDRGLFLERTYRMHPDVCRFVSDAFYESRLESAEGCERQGTALGTGLRFVTVEHSGNRRSSLEEAYAIREELRSVVEAAWTDGGGLTRPLRVSDVLVVAPYNEQVGCLTEILPDGVRIGTVDKFQGQEAPVVFFSMATSSGADVPRNLEFLFSRNRLNVAVSRARCLAYVVASPRLLEADCRTIEQMRMANALCRFVELAT